MRSRIRSILTLLLLGAVLLEALAWIRAPLFDALHRAYPIVGLDDEGRAAYFDDESRRADGSWGRELDLSRNPPEVVRARQMRLRFAGSRFRPYRMNLDFDSPRFLVQDLYARAVKAIPAPLEILATQLNDFECSRRGLPYGHDDGTRLSLVLEPDRPRILWGAEEGRLVCREAGTGRAVAGLGPDGYARGDGAAEGARFGRIDGPFNAVREDRAEWLLLDVAKRAIHAVSVAKPQPEAKDSAEPLAVSVEQRPFRPFRDGESETDALPLMKVQDRRVLVFLRDGSVTLEVELEPGERVANSTGAMLVRSEGLSGSHDTPSKPKVGDFGIETTLAPCAPDTERRRLRVVPPGGPEVVRDVTLVPTRPNEVLFANLAAALAVVRPPPLALASALSPLPADHRETWWWRDAWLAGGRYPGWLALSLALAGFLAWRARRAARERCATPRAVRFWTASVLLLGPVGLLWMKLVLPRVPVEDVGGARRAVDLDASPSTSAPWPEPKPQGIEVFS